MFRKSLFTISAASLISIALTVSGCSSPKLQEGTSSPASAAAADKNGSSRAKKAAEPSVSKLSLSAKNLVLYPGQTKKLQLTASLDNGKNKDVTSDAQYESSQTGTISVGSDGTIRVTPNTPIGEEAEITAQYDSKKKDCKVIVKYSLAATVQINDDNIPVVTNPDSIYVVVNKHRDLPSNYIPKLVKPSVTFAAPGNEDKNHMRPTAAKALESMFATAKQDGITLNAVSGYRSYKTQQGLFNYYVKVQGLATAEKFSAHPGQSEHQTGLAMDVSSPGYHDQLEDGFGDTPAGKWLAAHCADYGFIIRYPKGKEKITGYAYEPWHVRYVGKDLAKDIMAQGIALEEFFQNATPVQGSPS